MKNVLICTVAFLLLTACSEEKNQGPGTQTDPRTSQAIAELAQFVSQKDQQNQPTPPSISGNERHSGPNPHGQLSSEQHIAVAYKHADAGRIDEALDVLTRALISNPDDVSIIGARGGLLLAQDRIFDALVDLDKAVTLAPHSAELRVNRSQAYRKFKRYPEAMADLDKAVSLDPRLLAARFNRGSLLYAVTQYEEALADFDRCIVLAAQTPGPYFNRAITREALGNRAGAVSDMNTFIKLSDNPEWNKVAQETLASWHNAEPEIDRDN
jgi:tetratricopeptide (TPR) repeat protein